MSARRLRAQGTLYHRGCVLHSSASSARRRRGGATEGGRGHALQRLCLRKAPPSPSPQQQSRVSRSMCAQIWYGNKFRELGGGRHPSLRMISIAPGCFGVVCARRGLADSVFLGGAFLHMGQFLVGRSAHERIHCIAEHSTFLWARRGSAASVGEAHDSPPGARLRSRAFWGHCELQCRRKESMRVSLPDRAPEARPRIRGQASHAYAPPGFAAIRRCMPLHPRRSARPTAHEHVAAVGHARFGGRRAHEPGAIARLAAAMLACLDV